MASAQPAFGEMFRGLIELGVVEIDTEPLDACIERRLKEFWEHTFCPRCGLNAVQTWPSLDRVWCRDCNFKPVYTDGTPFHEKHLAAVRCFSRHPLRGYIAQHQSDRAAARTGVQDSLLRDSRG